MELGVAYDYGVAYKMQLITQADCSYLSRLKVSKNETSENKDTQNLPRKEHLMTC